MFFWIIKWVIISVILISLSHYIYVYLMNTLTVPKTRDLIKSPNKRYEEMLSKQIDETISIVPMDTSKSETPQINSESQMEAELTSFIETLKS